MFGLSTKIGNRYGTKLLEASSSRNKIIEENNLWVTSHMVTDVSACRIVSMTLGALKRQTVDASGQRQPRRPSLAPTEKNPAGR